MQCFACIFAVETPGRPHHVPKLRACIAKVPRLIGCEAAYYFPKGLDLCHMPEEGEGKKNESTGGGLDHEEAGAVVGSRKQNGATKGAGTLAIHIRSGDIFDNEVLADYGQVKYSNLARCQCRLWSAGILHSRSIRVRIRL